MERPGERIDDARQARPAEGAAVSPGFFSTEALPPAQQFEAWHARVGRMIDLAPVHDPRRGYAASNRLWHLGAMAYSPVIAPAVGFSRTEGAIRRDSIDHWMLLSVRGGNTVFRVEDRVVIARPGMPVIMPMGMPHGGRRTDSDWKALFLPRDSFAALAPQLDAASALACDAPFGQLIDDFMHWLDRSLPSMTAEHVAALPGVMSALLAACLGGAPRPARAASAEAQRQAVDIARRERVRRLIRANLGAHTLGPRMLCRAAGVSRSTLYRLFEHSGGVAATIQRERLRVAHAALSNPADQRPIWQIAESLAFADASTFSRAFRAEFDTAPREVRLAALVGEAPGHRRTVAAPGNPADLVGLLMAL